MSSSRFDPERIRRFDAAVSAVLDGPAADRAAAGRSHAALFATATPFDVLGLARFRSDDPDRVAAIGAEAGKLVHLFHRGLAAFPWQRDVHPALVLLRSENDRVRAAAEALKPRYERLADAGARAALATAIAAFGELEKKFRKAELLLHPALDAHLPSPMPLKVLWALHDAIRKACAELPDRLREARPGDDLAAAVGTFHYQLVGLLEKEELILYPAASILLSAAEWDGILAEARAFGTAFGAAPEAVASHPAKGLTTGGFAGPTGRLDAVQLERILASLPLELTFVDAEGITRWYSESAERIFARTPQILGRPVENCHPPKSVPVVRRLIEAFRDGTQNEAEMWTEVRGRFLRIVYKAVRDEEGRYLGILEHVQDLTRLRTLSGTKENLDF